MVALAFASALRSAHPTGAAGSSTGNVDSRAPSDGSSASSPDSAGSPDVFAGIPIDDLPERYVAAYCAVVERCFGPIFSVFLPGESCDTPARALIEDELPRLKMAIDAGRINYDGTLIQTCLDEMIDGAGAPNRIQSRFSYT